MTSALSSSPAAPNHEGNNMSRSAVMWEGLLATLHDTSRALSESPVSNDETTPEPVAGKDEIESDDFAPEPMTRRRSSPPPRRRKNSILSLERIKSGWSWGVLHFRPYDDDDEQDWWFASTAVPLLAATIGPLANVLSIGALVTTWRMSLIPETGQSTNGHGPLLPQFEGNSINDPRWAYWLNVVSLITGFAGNFFLLLNFTNRIRYIIALPMTIVFWYISPAILIALTVAFNKYNPPIRPEQIYTQGFWYAIIAAALYLICSMTLMVNMLGYFLGHYPQHFNLTESQRTLILQTMMFFIWLAGGAGVFSLVENTYGQVNVYGKQGWSFVDALYFCDVTILTVGFGDLDPTDDVGRGLVFPYAVGGIIILGLMISSISDFAGELGKTNVLRKHVDKVRRRTLERTISNEVEFRRTIDKSDIHSPNVDHISRPFNERRGSQGSLTRKISDPALQQTAPESESAANNGNTTSQIDPSPRRAAGLGKVVHRAGTLIQIVTPAPRRRKPRAILLREEKDRFDAMRKIQDDSAKFKQWTALAVASIAFGILWAVGAVVFWETERNTQGMSYFQALYFCYVSLLTIGYGDFAPESNAGRPFFVVWSLIAVPTMTILISSMGNTLISRFRDGTSWIADFTVLPKEGIWHDFFAKHKGLLSWLQRFQVSLAAREREGLPVGPDPTEDEGRLRRPTIAQLAAEEEKPPSDHERAKRLALAIKQVARDLKLEEPKRYSYEEWVEYTELIRFSTSERYGREPHDEDPVEWDWIGENSPMMTGKAEAEFILDRLCESMTRYIRRQAAKMTTLEEQSDTTANGSGSSSNGSAGVKDKEILNGSGEA